MRMGQGVRTGLGHGGITCVLQTQFSSLRGRLMGQTACVCLFVVSYLCIAFIGWQLQYFS